MRNYIDVSANLNFTKMKKNKNAKNVTLVVKNAMGLKKISAHLALHVNHHSE